VVVGAAPATMVDLRAESIERSAEIDSGKTYRIEVVGFPSMSTVMTSTTLLVLPSLRIELVEGTAMYRRRALLTGLARSASAHEPGEHKQATTGQ
jgi:hypothetical protein